MVDLLKKIHQEKEISLFLIEHVMEVVMPISRRVIVLDGGEKIAEGLPKDIVKNERVIKAYLGRSMLKVTEIEVRYSGIPVIHNVSLK